MRLFKKASQELVRRYYPEYSGPVGVYALQSHVLDKVLWPLIDRHLRTDHVVADLGCGSGGMLYGLRPRVASAVGVDQDDSHFWMHPDLNLIKGTLYHLPIKTGMVDFAMSRWVFEHLADPGAAIAEIRRILKPKGLVLIIVPNVLHPLIALTRILPLGVKQRLLFSLSGIKEETVIKTYYRANTESALDRLFGAAGFKKVEFVYLRDPSYWLFCGFLFRCVMAMRALAESEVLRRFQMDIVALYREGDT